MDKVVREVVRVSNTLVAEYNRLIEIKEDNYQHTDLEVRNIFHGEVSLSMLKSTCSFNICRIQDYIINK